MSWKMRIRTIGRVYCFFEVFVVGLVFGESDDKVGDGGNQRERS
jgi:hypothetical protein